MGTWDYYTALARQLSPAELARATMRRAYRAARLRLYRHQAFAAEQILQAFGAGTPAALAACALDDRPGRGWCERGQRRGVLEALARIPGASERALARAEAACARRFEVFGTSVCFGEDARTDWSLDAGSGQRYPLVPSAELSLLRGRADPKYPWVLGRLDHLIALGQGYWVAADAERRGRYSRAFVQEAADFISANPVGIGIHWTCPMEVALRAANLAQALVMMGGAPDVRAPSFLGLALGSLADHLQFVEAHLEDQGAVPNNHLVANYVGLLAVGVLFPQLPGAPRAVALAAEGLKTELSRQVHPDGSSFEGSIPYHRLAVELFTLGHVLAGAYGVSLGAAYAERLKRMFEGVAAYCSEAGLAPQLGDNDSGRVFPLRDRQSLDHGYLPALGAALLSEPALKLAGSELPDEAAWLLGKAGATRFERLPARAQPGSGQVQGGWCVLRGGGAVVTASVGRNGQQGVGGHSHNDKLSFELHLDGVPLIVDPGTGTYGRDPAQRNAFRATAAHNTLVVDGREQAPLDPARLFALPDTAAAEVEIFQAGAGIDRLAARHRGYAELPNPVEVERTLILDKVGRALCGADTLLGEGWHKVSLRFHLPDTRARLRPVSEVELARALRAPGAPSAFGPIAAELGPAGAPRAVVLFEAGLEPALVPAEHSPGYGQVVPALALEVQKGLKAPGRLGWVVLLGRGG